jgi:hypothetical protein
MSAMGFCGGTLLRSQPTRRTNHRAKGINELCGSGIAFKRPRTRVATRLFVARASSKMDTPLTTFGERRRSDAGITTGGGQSA